MVAGEKKAGSPPGGKGNAPLSGLRFGYHDTITHMGGEEEID
jgi:hypothetical protein